MNKTLLIIAASALALASCSDTAKTKPDSTGPGKIKITKIESYRDQDGNVCKVLDGIRRDNFEALKQKGYKASSKDIKGNWADYYTQDNGDLIIRFSAFGKTDSGVSLAGITVDRKLTNGDARSLAKNAFSDFIGSIPSQGEGSPATIWYTRHLEVAKADTTIDGIHYKLYQSEKLASLDLERK